MKVEISIAIVEEIDGRSSPANAVLEAKECLSVSASARVNNPVRLLPAKSHPWSSPRAMGACRAAVSCPRTLHAIGPLATPLRSPPGKDVPDIRRERRPPSALDCFEVNLLRWVVTRTRRTGCNSEIQTPKFDEHSANRYVSPFATGCQVVTSVRWSSVQTHITFQTSEAPSTRMIGPPDFNPSDESSEVIQKCRNQFAAGDPVTPYQRALSLDPPSV